MSPVLQASSASFRVNEASLVMDASLDLLPGSIAIIVGPNGAGKSTLLRMLAGELRPSSGAILCDEAPLNQMANWRLASKRAVMAQSSRLSFPFAVHEVVRLGLEGVARSLAPRERERIVAKCLRDVEALEFASQLFQTLSGGEQQRVQFARAMAQLEAGRIEGSAQALLLDEPVASLDLHHQLALMDAARDSAKRGVAVLAILHDLNLAAQYADVLVVMDRGRIVAHDQPASVLSEPLISQVFKIDLKIAPTGSSRVPMIFPRSWLTSAPALRGVATDR